MSKNLFTPGPWTNLPRGECVGICRSDEVGLQIGFIHSSCEKRMAEGAANARLIAASPDLFAAACRVLEKLDHPTNSVTAFDADALRDAIAKARGEA